jgi:hypothetical protein
MMSDFKIEGVDRFTLAYSDKNVSFTIGREAGFENGEVAGVYLDNEPREISRGKLSGSGIEMQRIKDWLVTTGGFPKVY